VLFRRCRRGERGETLVEILVSIVIIGICFAAILGGLTSSIFGSRVHREQATVETVLRSYAEATKAQVNRPGGYLPCASGYNITSYNPPSGFVPSITSVQWWDGATFRSSGCTAAAEKGLQTLSLRAQGPEGAFEVVDIVVRKS
jgi:prepilin-type N-terminal cleavage/methylation domain-containing protein